MHSDSTFDMLISISVSGQPLLGILRLGMDGFKVNNVLAVYEQLAPLLSIDPGITAMAEYSPCYDNEKEFINGLCKLELKLFGPDHV